MAGCFDILLHVVVGLALLGHWLLPINRLCKTKAATRNATLTTNKADQAEGTSCGDGGGIPTGAITPNPDW